MIETDLDRVVIRFFFHFLTSPIWKYAFGICDVIMTSSRSKCVTSNNYVFRLLRKTFMSNKMLHTSVIGVVCLTCPLKLWLTIHESFLMTHYLWLNFSDDIERMSDSHLFGEDLVFADQLVCKVIRVSKKRYKIASSVFDLKWPFRFQLERLNEFTKRESSNPEDAMVLESSGGWHRYIVHQVTIIFIWIFFINFPFF